VSRRPVGPEHLRSRRGVLGNKLGFAARRRRGRRTRWRPMAGIDRDRMPCRPRDHANCQVGNPRLGRMASSQERQHAPRWRKRLNMPDEGLVIAVRGAQILES
jgi:hypothetical protein